MTSHLFEEVRNHMADLQVAALVAETELEPLSGPGTPVAPPTYAGDGKDRNEPPKFAFSEGAFVPAQGDSEWFLDLSRKEDGTPRLAGRVAIDSVGADSGRAETALWQSRGQDGRLGVDLPGIVLRGEEPDRSGSQLKRETAAALSIDVSSWETAHRQSDAWFRAATLDGKKQIWDETGSEESRQIKDRIASAGARNGADLYRYFPNAAIYGFWNSSGTAARHKLPRAYSSQIVGYGAHPITVAATKLDPVGAIPNDKILQRKDGVVGFPKSGGTKPSELGFGQVPGAPMVRAFVCELILQQSSISLEVLRSLRFEDDAQALAGRTALCLLAIAGRCLASESGYLRSGCALVARGERWGWRRHHSGSRVPEPLEIGSTEQVIAAFREAVDAAGEVGLEFSEPTNVWFSPAEKDLVQKMVENALNEKSDRGE